MTIDMYSDDEYKRLPLFDKLDIQRLMYQLHMPDFFHFPRKAQVRRFDRVFSFLLFLRRMASPGRLTNLETEFGREHTSLSRSLAGTLDWLHENHSEKITDNLPFFVPYKICSEPLFSCHIVSCILEHVVYWIE